MTLGFFPEAAQDLIIYVQLFLLLTIAITIASIKGILSKIALLSAFSLLLTSIYSMMDAPDVAMTEASVNAAIGTIFLLAAVLKGNIEIKSDKSSKKIAFIVCSMLAIAIIYGLRDIPNFSYPDTPVFGDTYKYYIENTRQDIGIPSMVTAILASYRGFDTLCEAIVIFIAGVAVSTILSRDSKEEQNNVIQSSNN